MKRILIVEDDPAISKGLEESLVSENYEVTIAEEGEKGYNLCSNKNFDLMILDVMLPLTNGFEVIQQIRKDGNDIPVIMLTSKKDEIDRVLGLECGADDYVTKPFSVRELLARIKAVLRRKADLVKEFSEYSFADVFIDFKKCEVKKNKKQIKVTAKELSVLKYLIQHEGEVVTRDKLLDDVWGYDIYPTTRTVDNIILCIRKKIEDDSTNPKHILTVHSIGYKFVK